VRLVKAIQELARRARFSETDMLIVRESTKS